MDSGVKSWRSYKDKVKLRTKPRMQSDVLNTELSKRVKNYKPVAVGSSDLQQLEARQDGEEGQTGKILKSDETARLRNVVIDHDYGHWSVKCIHQILDDVLSSVVNVETDKDGKRQESEHIAANDVEEGDIVIDNEDLIESCWLSDVSNDETCFDEIFQNSSDRKELDDKMSKYFSKSLNISTSENISILLRHSAKILELMSPLLYDLSATDPSDAPDLSDLNISESQQSAINAKALKAGTAEKTLILFNNDALEDLDINL